MQTLALAAVLAGTGACRAQENVEKMRHGLLIKFSRLQVELAPAGIGALRLSVATNGRPKAAASSFLADPEALNSAAWRKIEQNGMVGVQTEAGRLLMDPRNGEWTLQDAGGRTLIPKHVIGDGSAGASLKKSNLVVLLGWDPNRPVKVCGCGNGVNALQQSRTTTGVANGRAVLPYYWSPAGYAVLAVTADDNRPAWWVAAGNGSYLTWNFPGKTADLYLMPAASLKDAAGAYARLTGRAPVPPRWAFGYLQSRWGWKNRSYIENTLKRFRALNLAVDAFIYDFEWYTTEPDYELPAKGAAGFSDFGWNTNLFPDPARQIASYKKQGVHFVGIRKPRLGNRDNLAVIRARGWNLPADQAGKAKFQARDVNFANPAFRKWYEKQSAPLIRDGVDGWWNDEGEATYTTYFYWNRAETEAFRRYRPGRRLWTLNRAFSPGTQRFGAAAWTGDIRSSWRALAATPTSLLNWSLAGMPYGACDIGGFLGNPSPELLSRWMEAGVFFPVMRSHSEIKATPRFPWLYGANALSAIRKALELRYRLIPLYYSLAHETFETGVPLMRPLVMEFPDDPRVANLSDEWLMGPSLLAAPVLQSGGRRSVYLPAGGWYVFGANTLLTGSQTVKLTVKLDEIPVYVRAGTLLPLGPVIQHTDQLPGGPLELQIYPGRDATFALFEDDGETTGYLKGRIRRTTFRWQDTAGKLRWKRQGTYSGKDVFRKLRVVLFGPQGTSRTEVPLGVVGNLQLGK
ncbi:MAG: glycoside hydrolase family 31 protein [Verrucomicrobiota bacterium]|nr:glycoside hydrolase family 31 protein [Verrucomicrobiota bacterium]